MECLWFVVQSLRSKFGHFVIKVFHLLTLEALELHRGFKKIACQLIKKFLYRLNHVIFISATRSLYSPSTWNSPRRYYLMLVSLYVYVKNKKTITFIFIFAKSLFACTPSDIGSLKLFLFLNIFLYIYVKFILQFHQ